MQLRSFLHRVGRLRDPEARGRSIRAYAFPLAGRITPFLGVEHEGVRYVISTRESGGVGYGTFVTGTFDEEVLRRMLVQLEQHRQITTLRGMTILEVGANIGTETVSLLKRHGAERVLAFEPDAENVRFLRANLALNGLHDRAEIHEMALSDVDATLLLESSAENWGDHRIRVAERPRTRPAQRAHAADGRGLGSHDRLARGRRRARHRARWGLSGWTRKGTRGMCSRERRSSPPPGSRS